MPERLRSSASIASRAPWPSRRRLRSEASSRSASSRIAPPAEARTGGSGARVSSTRRTRSLESGMPSRIARRRNEASAAPAERTAGTARSPRPRPRPPGPRRSRRDPRETPFQVPDVLERPPQSLPFGGAARQLLDGVPARLELDRIGGRTRESVLERPRPEGSSASVDAVRTARSRIRPDSKISSVAIAHWSRPIRSRSARQRDTATCATAGRILFRVGSRGSGGLRAESLTGDSGGALPGRSGKPLRRTARQRIPNRRAGSDPSGSRTSPAKSRRVGQAVQRTVPVKLPIEESPGRRRRRGPRTAARRRRIQAAPGRRTPGRGRCRA